MSTVRLIVVDAPERCLHCDKTMESRHDDEDREVWSCVNSFCPADGAPIYPNVGGYATEGAPAGTWKVEQCRACGAEIIWCDTVNGRRMPVDGQPSPVGIFSLHRAGDRVQAQYDWGHRSRRLYSSHARTCTAKAVAS